MAVLILLSAARVFVTGRVSITAAMTVYISYADILCDGHQGEEWRRTALASAVDLFETCFLHGMEADAKERLTTKARTAAATPTFAW